MGIYRQFGRPDIDALTTSAGHRHGAAAPLSFDAPIFIQYGRSPFPSSPSPPPPPLSLSLFSAYKIAHEARKPLEKYSRPREVFIRTVLRAQRDHSIRLLPIKIRAPDKGLSFHTLTIIRYIQLCITYLRSF